MGVGVFCNTSVSAYSMAIQNVGGESAVFECLELGPCNEQKLLPELRADLFPTRYGPAYGLRVYARPLENPTHNSRRYYI